MNNTQLKHIVVVLGMHRSGTSVLTRGLEVLGVNLGDRLLPPASDNQKGFWEDLDINALNIALLKALGHDWHTLTPVVPEELVAPAVVELKLRAVEVLRNKLSVGDCFGLKDPRIPRLLPFWKDIFTHLQARVSYVIACRNPVSVAHSLAKRNGFDLEKSYYLWLEHMLRSLTQTVGKTRIVVDYDRLMEDPAGQLQRVAQSLGLSFDPKSTEFAEYRNQFLEDSLRHTRYRVEDLHQDKTVPPSVITLYKALVELAADTVTFDHPDVMSLVNHISAQFSENYPALHYMQACDDRASLLACQLAERDKRLAELDQTIIELQNNIGGILRAVSNNEEERRSLADLVQAVIERSHEMAGLRESLRERDTHIELLTNSLSERDRQITELTQSVAERDRQLAALYDSTSWRITWPLRFGVHQIKRSIRVAQLALPAVKRGGGLKSTFKKAVWLFRREGLEGIKRGFRVVAAPEQVVSYNVDSYPFLKTISCQASILLGPRVVIIAELSIPQCTKYRVKQKQEMLTSLGIHCSVHSWTDRKACFDALSTHSIAFFYRVPAYRDVLEIVAEAKRLKVVTYWEVDDLIFDRELLAKSKTLAALDQTTFSGLLDGADLYRKAMLACDKGIASTAALARAMQEAGVPEVFVIENALDQQTLDSAEALRTAQSRSGDDIVRIVYGSGTHTHNIDFQEVAAALLYVLSTFRNVRFRLIGTLDLPNGFAQYESQIERTPFCTYNEYLQHLAECDINIAPLENYIFNDAKSNIKFLEASVLKVPSVCSPRAAFRQAINHGVNGFLCETTEEWITVLTLLITDAGMRRQIGAAAYASVLDTYSLARIASQQLLPLVMTQERRARKLRVLSTNVYYSPRSYGGATIVAGEINKILNAGTDFEVFVFTTLPTEVVPAYCVRRYEADGVSVFGMGLPETGDARAQFENADALNAFENVLSAVKPDLVHFHSLQGIGVNVADLCREKGIPYVVTLHDAWWLCGRQFMVNRHGKFCNQEKIDMQICSRCVDNADLNNYRQARLALVLKNASRLLAPSQYFADFYIRNGFSADSILVNKNGIRKPVACRRVRRAGSLVFGYVSGNTDIKGWHLIKKVFSDLDGVSSKLLIVDNTINLGFSSFDKSFVERVNGVEIVPAYTQSTIDEFFSRIDVLLFPTQAKESFGLVVREALARNVWVIATDAGGVIEDIEPGKNGLIIPLDDNGEALKQAVLDTIQYYEQFEVGAEVCHETKQIVYFEQQASELADIFKNLVSPRLHQREAEVEVESGQL